MVIRTEGLEVTYPGRAVLKALTLRSKKENSLGCLGAQAAAKAPCPGADGIIPNLIGAEVKGKVTSFGKDTRETSVQNSRKK